MPAALLLGGRSPAEMLWSLLSVAHFSCKGPVTLGHAGDDWPLRSSDAPPTSREHCSEEEWWNSVSGRMKKCRMTLSSKTSFFSPRIYCVFACNMISEAEHTER